MSPPEGSQEQSLCRAGGVGNDWFPDLAVIFVAAERKLAELSIYRRSLHRELKALQELPCYERATIHFKARQYAYLKRWEDGRRSRTYIGCDPEKIAAAQLAIDRGTKAYKLKREILQAEREAAQFIEKFACIIRDFQVLER